jgi:hypothetical protein
VTPPFVAVTLRRDEAVQRTRCCDVSDVFLEVGCIEQIHSLVTTERDGYGACQILAAAVYKL